MQLPPDDSCMEPGRCMISGLKSYALVNLCPKMLASDKILVSPSLLHFFQVYWFIMKLDYIVRNFTRSWLDDRIGESTIQEICNEFSGDEQFMQSAWTVFKHGCSHILQSVSHHEESCKRQEIIDPALPAEGRGVHRWDEHLDARGLEAAGGAPGAHSPNSTPASPPPPQTQATPPPVE